MKIYNNFFFILALLCSPVLSANNASINELNSCHAVVDFVDIKLDEFAEHYAAEDIALIHQGLSAYSEFLQKEVITPKLLAMYGGNVDQAKFMQRLFDRQKMIFFHHLNERYSEKKLFTEYAVAINDCSAKTRISADVAKALNTAINLMIKLAQPR